MAEVQHVDLDAIAETIITHGGRTEELTRIARRLAQNEFFDRRLYLELARREPDPEIRAMLEQIAEFEQRHQRFWMRLAGIEEVRLTWYMRLKQRFFLLLRKLLGRPITLLTLESAEHYGITKYVHLWRKYRNTPVGQGIQAILIDELRHEEAAITGATERRIRSEDIRNVILGLNDGLVEVLGSVGGFYGAFQDPLMVAIAATIVGIAGSISMAAGAYASVKSEAEIHDIDRAKAEVLAELSGDDPQVPSVSPNPIRAAMVVGVSYILGALIPVLPLWLGMDTPWLSFVCGLTAAGLIAAVLAALSGIGVFRKLVENALIVTLTVLITYTIGWLAKQWLGIEVV